jgi:hypothetical protein
MKTGGGDAWESNLQTEALTRFADVVDVSITAHKLAGPEDFNDANDTDY